MRNWRAQLEGRLIVDVVGRAFEGTQLWRAQAVEGYRGKSPAFSSLHTRESPCIDRGIFA